MIEPGRDLGHVDRDHGQKSREESTREETQAVEKEKGVCQDCGS